MGQSALYVGLGDMAGAGLVAACPGCSGTNAVGVGVGVDGAGVEGAGVATSPTPPSW